MAKKRKAAAPAKKKRATVTGTRKRKKAGAVKVDTSAKHGTVSHLSKAEKIVRNIDKLEAKRKMLKGQELKDIAALVINAEHQKLKTINRQLRSKLR